MRPTELSTPGRTRFATPSTATSTMATATFRTLFITRPTLRAVLIFFATASPSVMGFSPNISLRSAYVQVTSHGNR